MSFQEKPAADEGGMSYQEKTAVASVVGLIVIYTLYSLIVLRRYPGAGESVYVFWGRVILGVIIVQIVFQIVMAILLNIGNTIVTQEQEDPSFLDERDKIIDLYATRNTMIVFGVGFLLAMLAAAIARPPTLVFALIFVFMMVADILGNLSKIRYYRRGI